LTVPAPLTITLRPSAPRHRRRLPLLARAGAEAAFGSTGDVGVLMARRQSLSDDLYQVRQELGRSGTRIDPGAGGAALTRMVEIGTLWVSSLLGRDIAGRTGELMAFMQRVAPE
jgi:hypothetical protein